MKVLFINTVCGRSSTGGIVRDIADLLYENGDEAMCLYGRYTAPAHLNALRIDTKLAVYFHVLITRLFDRQGFGSVRATKKAIKAIEEYRPDVIHLHNLHGSYLNIRLLFSYLKKSNIPVVWTLHDCWPFTGHCTHYIYDHCEKWKDCSCDRCPRKTEYPASFLLDRSKKNIAQKREIFTGCDNLVITTVSDWLADQARQSFLKGYPVRRIYNGVSLSQFAPTETKMREQLGITRDQTMILCVTDGWSKRKGLDHIIKAAEEIRSRELPYRIVMVGVQDSVRKQLPPEIIALSRTDNRQQLVELYSCADVLWNPSPAETFGLVNVEAMACGTPVITMDTTACPETIDETCGRVIHTDGNVVEEFLAAVQSLGSQGPSIMTACTERAKAFSKEKSYSNYLELYKEMMQ